MTVRQSCRTEVFSTLGSALCAGSAISCAAVSTANTAVAPQRGHAKVEGDQREPGQRAEQYAGLIEDVEHREGLDAPCTGVGREVRAHRRVEQRAGETGCRRGYQYHRKRLRHNQHAESGCAQQASGDDGRFVAETISERATENEHSLLGEVAHAEHQADRPGGQSQRTRQIVGQVRHQHVEAHVDAELVDHEHLAGSVEATKSSKQTHYRSAFDGSTTVVHLVQDRTTCSAGCPMTAGSGGATWLNKSW